jgi:hypothetical protein
VEFSAQSNFLFLFFFSLVSRALIGKTRGTPGYIVGGTTLHVLYDDLDVASFYGTAFHEGAHQFFAAMLPGATLPHWLNEAMASYFEGCVYSRATGKISVGALPPDRLTFAKMQLARATDASPESMFMRYGQPEYTALHYALGWSFVYYLTHTEGGRYRAGFGKFLREMNGSGAKPVRSVFAAAACADLDTLSHGWRNFVLGLEAPPTPEWVLLAVDGPLAGVDLRTGDMVVRLAGTEIFDHETFTTKWSSLQAGTQPFQLDVLRRQGEPSTMDYDLAPIRVTLQPGQNLPVYAGGRLSRSHNLAD